MADIIELENGGTLLTYNGVYENPSEKAGLLIPTELTNRLIKEIKDKTLRDDHETLNAMAIRACSVAKGTYKWYGDPDFERLSSAVRYFYTSSINPYGIKAIKKCNPEFIFSMGRLYAIVTQLSEYLRFVTDKEPFASKSNVTYANTVPDGEGTEVTSFLYLYKNEDCATDYWVGGSLSYHSTVLQLAKKYFGDTPFTLKSVWELGNKLYWEQPNKDCNTQVWCAYADKENNN